jgi:hypothetical protein
MTVFSMAALLAATVLLIQSVSIDAIDASRLHKHWKAHLERKYAMANILPLIGRLAGADGKVLEVGCDPTYNQYDAKFAGVSPDRWHFVDVYDYNKRLDQSVSGKLLIYPLNVEGVAPGFAGLGEEWNSSFRVIYDNTLHFYANASWGAGMKQSDIARHLDTYTRALEPGGFLIFKIDGWKLGWLLCIVGCVLSSAFAFPFSN